MCYGLFNRRLLLHGADGLLVGPSNSFNELLTVRASALPSSRWETPLPSSRTSGEVLVVLDNARSVAGDVVGSVAHKSAQLRARHRVRQRVRLRAGPFLHILPGQ